MSRHYSRKHEHVDYPVKAYDNPEFIHSSDGRLIRVMSEMIEPKHRFTKYNIKDSIAFFGSARTKSREDSEKNLAEAKASGDSEAIADAETWLEMSRYYEEARELSRMLTEWSQSKKFHHFISSGGGPGIMEAANRGASEVPGGHSIGLNISLPFEQSCNPYITPELNFEFNYFFVRKFWFTYTAKAIVAFPGGLGTLDELCEILTLIQTEKILKKMPIIIYGKQYWKEVINFEALMKYNMICPKDLELFKFCDSPQEAFDYLTPILEDLHERRAKGEKI